jgi:magnesium-transporting ATPase (P-type)
MSKGADSIIEALLSENQSSNLQSIMHFVSEFANEGLRTLLLAQREIDEDYYTKWA